MQCRFIHAADIHLGYEQYNLANRADDFARAYFEVAQYAVETHPNFVLIAGDLFDRSNPDAWTMKQATHGLQMLRKAGIPVVAIEGNHDAQHQRKHLSWLEYLCDQDLLYLLDATQQTGTRVLTAFDYNTRRGSWVDVDGARIFGLKYYGALTARVIEEVAPQIEPASDGFTVFMLHQGLVGQVPHMHGGLSPAQIEPLRSTVDYLALGHIHKRLLEEGGWVFNPGSTETNSMEEIGWPHGFFDVTVDTDTSPQATVQPVETPTLRPFRRISVISDESKTVRDFVQRVDQALEMQDNIPANAVVELHLSGSAQFRRQDVPIDQFKGSIELRFEPLVVRIRNNLTAPGTVSMRVQEGMTRRELERQVIERLVYDQGEYRDSAGAWASLILDVKNMATEQDLPASIVDHVRAALNEWRQKPEQTPLTLPVDCAPPLVGSTASPQDG